VTKTPNAIDLRFDLRIIASWIEPGSTVLDLGCGQGDLLAYLQQHKQVTARGIDRHEEKVAQCIARRLSVVQGDLNREVEDYKEGSFDYVILSQTLQQVYEPARLLEALLRIGKKVVVSFPNFSHWKSRMQLLLTGHAPKTRQLPFEWYDTPNIRVITWNDFHKFIGKFGFRIVRLTAINTSHHELQGTIVSFLPSLRATYGIIMIENARDAA